MSWYSPLVMEVDGIVSFTDPDGDHVQPMIAIKDDLLGHDPAASLRQRWDRPRPSDAELDRWVAGEADVLW